MTQFLKKISPMCLFSFFVLHISEKLSTCRYLGSAGVAHTASPSGTTVLEAGISLKYGNLLAEQPAGGVTLPSLADLPLLFTHPQFATSFQRQDRKKSAERVSGRQEQCPPHPPRLICIPSYSHSKVANGMGRPAKLGSRKAFPKLWIMKLNRKSSTFIKQKAKSDLY